MIETTAYFEAYRHVLTVLQEISVETFPLKEYIIFLKNEIRPPTYAEDEKTVYCFGDSIVLKEKKVISFVELGLAESERLRLRALSRTDEDESNSNRCPCPGKKVYIHQETAWNNIDMSLDDSQLKAVKCALTQSVSVIQGPPGTGKTYIGLKIVEILLHNQQVWSPESDESPIVIVCYTNHALDQFLEGILKKTTKVVRIGGRSKCESLSSYNLSSLRQRTPRNFLTMKNDIRGEIRIITREIAKQKRTRDSSTHKLLSVKELLDVILDDHLQSLIDHRPFFLKQFTDPDFLLCLWLGLEEPDNKTLGEIQNVSDASYEGSSDNESDYNDDDLYYPYVSHKAGNTNTLEASNANTSSQNIVQGDNHNTFGHEDVDEVKGEVDLDYLNDQRMIDGDSINVLQAFEYPNDRELQPKAIFSDYLNCAPMTQERINQWSNVWHLNPEERWQLYRHWIVLYQEQCETEITTQRHEYKRQFSLLTECKQQIDRTTVMSSKIVGFTTTGAAKYNYLIRGIKSKIVIVEEAAEVLEAHVITALTANTQHLILIGDHKQLRPNPTVYELAKKFNLEISLFERLIKNRFPYCTLENQHRMKPCMSRLLVPEIYEDLIDDPSVHEYEEIGGMEKSMFFVTHTEKEFHSKDDTSRINIHEIDFLVLLCRHLLLQGYSPSKITILTTYLAQFFTLRKRMVGCLKDIKVCVLDNFQGEENDIILLSFVRSNEDERIGFLKEDNRVCVALSRAKKGMYCIGNFKLFASKSKLWRNICKKLEDQGAIGPALNVKCKRHGNLVSIRTPADFVTIPDGGCTENCDFRLECGHVCPKKCHPDDEEHLDFKCKKKCERINCEREHKCRKLCWEDCGDCTVLVEKVIPECSHKIRVPCFKDPQEVRCTEPCTKILNCSHSCPGLCGRSCELYVCSIEVTVTSPCGHEVRVECQYSDAPSKLKESCQKPCERFLSCGHRCTKLCKTSCLVYCNVVVEHLSRCGHLLSVPCSQAQEDRLKWTSSASSKLLRNTKSRLESGCEEPCGQELQCGHLCLGSCGSCQQGRIHVTCNEPCGKTLVCGHQCTSPCASNCPPCRRDCENRCVHSRCRAPCGFPCTPCREPCAWRCPHKRCSKMCSEPCDRTPCDEACRKRLRKCGHWCIGMCGEPCPKKCRICDAEEVKTIFFGEEDDPRARFLQLEDCGHVFEIQGISRWVEEQANDNEIKPITCPQCRKPIRKNLRFSTAVKFSVLKIEQVKQKTFGIRIQNINSRKELLLLVESESLFTIFDYSFGEKFSTDPKAILSAVKNALSSRKMPLEQGTITLFKNYVTFAQENRSLVSKFLKIQVNAGPKMSVSLENACDFMGRTLWVINKVILKNMQQGSDQLMDDLAREFDRLNFLVKFATNFKTAFQSINEDVSNKVTEILACLMSHAPFREEDRKKVDKLQVELNGMDGMGALGITDTERVAIVKAMGLRQGHWYQCPNGHVYCITECGGAMVESKCNECGAKIGGGSHRLRSDNRLASAMDGAVHSAWSEQQNIANYEVI